ncbi:MAG: cation:proton antiporter [Verrucomicrobia bacterium]|nr:cation:proton antiporter [Verrucomicrobiota bacterium]
MMSLSIFLALLFLYCLVSGQLEKTIFTGPILFTVAGMLLFLTWPGILAAGINQEVLFRLSEIGLVLLLFTDASHADLNILRRIGNLPARLLSVGMLLTIVLGAVTARLVFPHLSIWEAGILSAVLAPTDAGLGQVIVESPRVPMPIRQALNVEAGLNDGLSVPFLMFFIALAAAKVEGPAASLLQFMVEQLGYGVLVGGGIGLAGGWLLGLADRRRWIAESFQRIAVVALPLLCLEVSKMVGASMFIAAFVAGLAVQIGFKDAGKHSVEFVEEWGRLLNLAVFFLFGLVAMRALPQFNLMLVLYAVLSLTVVRMLPVAIALVGARQNLASVVFMGWFGPRGLASIVLGLVYLQQELQLPGETTIRLALIVTVLLSIFAHGLSAAPGISIYARKLPPSAAAASGSELGRNSPSGEE